MMTLPAADPHAARLHQAATALPPGAIRPRGWLERQLRAQADGITGRLEEVWPDVGPDSGWLGGPGENWERGPYYLDGLVPLAHALGDEALLATARPWIEWMLGSQRADGFFGPAANDDWWPRMVAAKVLIQHAEATEDERVAPFLLRWHRFQHAHLPQRPLSDWGRARGAEDVLAITWTYRATGEAWLLDLAALVLEQTFDWNEYLTTSLITGQAQVFTHSTHGVNVAMGLKTGAAAHLLDGDPGHRDRTETALANLDRWHGQAHGWFSGDEWLGGREATAGIETCLVVEMMYTAEVLSRSFGDAVHGDRLESLAVNLLPASSDPWMLGHQYHQQGTQLEASVARRNWSYSSDDANIFGLEPHFGCCTANLHQGWPKFTTSLWARDTDGGLRAVAYAPATVTTQAGGAPVQIDVDTQYPFEERITLTVTGDSRFPLRLRIPAWCQNPRLEIDGVGIAVHPGPTGHVELDRDWSGRSTLILTLPMRPRIVRRERQAAAVHLGPLVMVASPGESWSEVLGARGLGEWEIHPRTTWNWALVGLEKAGEWAVHRGAIPEAPWALGDALGVEATGCRVRQWEKVGVSADVPPASPVLDHGPIHSFRLVPYGTARLRVMEFPVAGAWASEGNEQEF
ncbi:beta-L-arabinofuranosidase domain-containing protein [Brachybacterium sp. FME24]|uniref:beta-L-arabinofuranosidase domain-containing protein n=1 Tax=Brachybacterium sp. FME24 TaxID=2742605 RepID=UPI0018665881|nr:beta-L-arabinofuranosidase domain-containing protein [Brachybacterium sp. FME24]